MDGSRQLGFGERLFAPALKVGTQVGTLDRIQNYTKIVIAYKGTHLVIDARNPNPLPPPAKVMAYDASQEVEVEKEQSCQCLSDCAPCCNTLCPPTPDWFCRYNETIQQVKLGVDIMAPILGVALLVFCMIPDVRKELSDDAITGVVIFSVLALAYAGTKKVIAYHQDVLAQRRTDNLEKQDNIRKNAHYQTLRQKELYDALEVASDDALAKTQSTNEVRISIDDDSSTESSN